MWRRIGLKLRTLDTYISYRGKGKSILSEGNENAEIMIILNDIKEEALLSGEILNSEEGKKLKDILNFIGIKLSDVYLTSLYKLDKGYINIGYNTIDGLLDILHTEILLVNPKYIISVGQEVFNVLVSDNLNLDMSKSNVDVYNSVGKIFKYNNMALIPIYDLSYITRAKKEEKSKIVEVLRSIK